MKVYWIVDWGVDSGVGRVIGEKLESGIGDEVGQGFELQVRGKVVYINISNMKPMRIFVTL